MPPPPPQVSRRLSGPQEVGMVAKGTVRNPMSPRESIEEPQSFGLKIAGANTFTKVAQSPDAQRRTQDGKWSLQQLRATDGLVPLQYGTNQFDSQKGKTGFGTPRNTKTRVVSTNPDLPPSDYLEFDDQQQYGRWSTEQLRATDGLVRLQSGTNQYDSQKGMTSFGSPRDVRGKHLKRIWELEFPDEADIIYNQTGANVTEDFPTAEFGNQRYGAQQQQQQGQQFQQPQQQGQQLQQSQQQGQQQGRQQYGQQPQQQQYQQQAQPQQQQFQQRTQQQPQQQYQQQPQQQQQVRQQPPQQQQQFQQRTQPQQQGRQQAQQQPQQQFQQRAPQQQFQQQAQRQQFQQQPQQQFQQQPQQQFQQQPQQQFQQQPQQQFQQQPQQQFQQQPQQQFQQRHQ